MSAPAHRRGQPLLVLSGLLLGWSAMRAAALTLGPASGAEQLIQADFAAPAAGPVAALVGQSADPQAGAAGPLAPGTITAADVTVPQFGPGFGSGLDSRLDSRPDRLAPAPAALPVWELRPVGAAPGRSPVPAQTLKSAMRITAGHQLLYTSAFSGLPQPAEVAALAMQRGSARPGAPRWSADAWLLWRQGSNGLLPAAALGGSYGASQAGAVMRYRLTDQARAALAVYLRSSAPLGQPDATELAVGLQAQPLRRVPLTTFAEVRGDRQSGKPRARLSAGVITAMGPQRLPLGLQAEPYGQAGYVTGPGATWFADGQLRLDRRVLRRGRAELRAGAGVWGGAQRDAARLDAGPGLTLSFPLGPAQARLSADWRYRIAGTAAPGSGLAVTLATGF